MKNLDYTYEELETLASEYEKALDVQTKFVNTYIKFIFGDDEVKAKFKEFMKKEIGIG